MAAVLVHSARIESRMLRSDPNGIPTQSALMAFALPRGAQQFQAHCTRCHGAGGRGDAERGIPDLSDGDWLYGTGSVSDIEQVVKYGIRSHHPKAWNLAIMPAYGTAHPSARDGNIPSLSPANIRDVVEFLVRSEGLAANAAPAARGERLFSGAAGCYDCHAADAKGDSAIGAPNLTDRITLYGGTRESLGASVTYGRHGMCPAWEGRLKPAAIREAALFAYSLSHPEAARLSRQELAR